jgi:hypothetical protein
MVQESMELHENYMSVCSTGSRTSSPRSIPVTAHVAFLYSRANRSFLFGIFDFSRVRVGR